MKKVNETIDYDNEGVQLPYRELGFEITRRCNMKCPHCMRGDAQNHTISREVIDKTLDGIEWIQTIFLTGGEPFLEPEMIEYLFGEIIRRKIPVYRVGTMTNGSIIDVKIAESFNKLTEYIAKNYGEKMSKKQLRSIGKITISCDDYHSPVDMLGAIKFYKEHLNKHTIITKEIGEDDHVLMLGNALKNKELFEGKELRWKVAPYKMEISKECIETTLQIGWDGKILIGEDSSYEQQDKYNYGNVLDKPISVLLTKGAFDEPLTQKEAKVYNYLYGKVQQGDTSYQGYLKYFDAIRCCRERMRYVYPFLTYEEACEAAYDDFNVWLKKQDEECYMFRLDTMESYDKTLEESSKAQKELYLKGLTKDPFGHLLRIKMSVAQGIDKTPIKI